MSSTKEKQFDVERPKTADKTLKMLHDSIDHLDRAHKQIIGFRCDQKRSHLRTAQYELKAFKNLHKKLRKKDLPEFGKKAVSGNRAWYKDLASTYNVLVREERYRRTFSTDQEDAYFFGED